MVLGVLVCGFLFLQFSGVLEFDAEDDAGLRGGDSDALTQLEDELFEEMRRGATLSRLPGIEAGPRGRGILTGAVKLHVPDGGLRALPGVRVQVLGRLDPRRRAGRDAAGNRIAGRDIAGHAAGLKLTPQETALDGSFTVPDVPAQGGYVIIVDHAPYRRIVLRGLSVTQDKTTDVGTLVLGAPTSLKGEVLDAKGRPIVGARVQVLRDGSRSGSFDVRRALFELQSAMNHLAQAEVQGDGRFVIKDLPPGRYLLRVSAPGFATTFKSGVLVTVDERSSRVRVILDPGSGFYGKVLDETGRGVANARLIAVAIPGKRLKRFDRIDVRTESDGSYRLDTLISGMNYFVEAWAEGYAPTGQPLPSVSGLKERNFQLRQSGRIEGRVTDAETGQGIADVAVSVVAGPIAGLSPVSTMTDESGAFALPNVNPGPIILFSAKAPGYQPVDPKAFQAAGGRKVVAGETTWVEWTLRAGGTVGGRVTAAGSRPVPYASIALVDRKSRRQRWTGEITGMSDVDGHYELPGVRAGEYDIRVSAPGHAARTEKEVTLVHMGKDLKSVTKDVVLLRGAVLRGAVVKPDGQALRGARIWIEGGGSSRGAVRDLEAVSGPSGAFRIAGVPAGVEVLVHAEHDAWVQAVAAHLRLTPGNEHSVTLKMRAGASLPGRVLDARGAPIADARLRWGNVDGVKERDLRDSFNADEFLGSRVLRSDNDGSFVIDGLPPGRLLLKVEHEGFAAWYRRDLSIGLEGVQPAVTATLLATMTVSGRVVGSDTKRPLERAFVYARERGPAEGQAEDPGHVQAVVSAETDANGHYLLDSVPPGTYEIVVWFAEGYVGAAQNWRDTKTRRKNVAAGARGIDFELNPIPIPGEDEAR